MKSLRSSFLGIFLGLAATACLGGCGDSGDSGDHAGHDHADHDHGADGADVPESLFVATAPADAKSVADVKVSAKEGDEVVVRGRVGGSGEPFVAQRAAMTLAGFSDDITACNDHPDDQCQTPWDFCCDRPEDILANTATVQIVGGDGKTLSGSLQGVHGIDYLTTLVVKGTVGPRPDPKVLVINATAIYVEK